MSFYFEPCLYLKSRSGIVCANTTVFTLVPFFQWECSVLPWYLGWLIPFLWFLQNNTVLTNTSSTNVPTVPPMMITIAMTAPGGGERKEHVHRRAALKPSKSIDCWWWGVVSRWWLVLVHCTGKYTQHCVLTFLESCRVTCNNRSI